MKHEGVNMEHSIKDEEDEARNRIQQPKSLTCFTCLTSPASHFSSEFYNILLTNGTNTSCRLDS